MNSIDIKNQKFSHKYRIVGKLGSDSLFTVLPKTLVQRLRIKQGDLLRIHEESNRIIIIKVDDKNEKE
jgi:hypothetical protein